MDATGLDNLQRLSSHGFLRDDPSGRPAITLDLLRDHAAGLFLLTGGTLGPVARLLGEGRRDAAARMLAALREAFPDRLAVELHRHGLPQEAVIEAGLLSLAHHAGLPIVAANDVYFAKRDMHEAHDALLCIAESRTMAERERRRVTPEHWFKPAADMRALFRDLPEACDNTLAIARMCAVMAESKKPELPVCPKVTPGHDRGRDRARHGQGGAREAARCACSRPLDEAARTTYRERLDYELGVIEKMGFSGYFLIVADFIQWAKAQRHPGRPGPRVGRGVGRGLGAADHRPRPAALRPAVRALPEPRARVDARLRHRLLPGPARRGDPLRRAANTARDRVAQIITFGKLQAKAAVRDVGRVLGMPYGQVDKIAEADPEQPGQAGHARAGDRGRAAPAGHARQRRTGRRGCWTSRCRSKGCTATPRPMPPAW